MVVDVSIKRLDDKSLLKIFRAAKAAGEAALENSIKHGEKFDGTPHTLRLLLQTGFPWKIEENEIDSAPDGTFSLSSMTLVFQFDVKNQRQERTETVSFSVTRSSSSAMSDQFKVNAGRSDSATFSPGTQSVLKAIHQSLSQVVQPIAPEDGGLVSSLSNLSEGFDTTYRRITTELSNTVAEVNKERTIQLLEFRRDYDKRKEQYAAEKQALEEEILRKQEVSQALIVKEREELEEQRAKLEISSHKDARRKQFQKLQTDLQEALNTPVATLELRAIRWAIFAALVIAGVVAASLASRSITMTVSESGSTASWLVPVIKTTILSFSSLAALLGAAAWLRYFYVRDLGAQEEMRRFRNDMARASWVMEAALEIRKEHDEEIPQEWISGVTEGLFAAQRKDTLEEGAQALAALVGLSASTTVGPNGTTFEIGKKGNKALSNAVKDMD